VYSTVEKLRKKIPDVEKNLEKSQSDLANMVTQENKAANEVNSRNGLCHDDSINIVPCIIIIIIICPIAIL